MHHAIGGGSEDRGEIVVADIAHIAAAQLHKPLQQKFLWLLYSTVISARGMADADHRPGIFASEVVERLQEMRHAFLVVGVIVGVGEHKESLGRIVAKKNLVHG